MTSSPDIDACKRAGETARDTADALLEEVETLKQQIVVKQREYERALSVAQDAEEADEQFREAFEEKQEQDREVAELKEQLQAAEDRRNQTSTRLKEIASRAYSGSSHSSADEPVQTEDQHSRSSSPFVCSLAGVGMHPRNRSDRISNDKDAPDQRTRSCALPASTSGSSEIHAEDTKHRRTSSGPTLNQTPNSLGVELEDRNEESSGKPNANDQRRLVLATSCTPVPGGIESEDVDDHLRDEINIEDSPSHTFKRRRIYRHERRELTPQTPLQQQRKSAAHDAVERTPGKSGIPQPLLDIARNIVVIHEQWTALSCAIEGCRTNQHQKSDRASNLFINGASGMKRHAKTMHNELFSQAFPTGKPTPMQVVSNSLFVDRDPITAEEIAQIQSTGDLPDRLQLRPPLSKFTFVSTRRPRGNDAPALPVTVEVVEKAENDDLNPNIDPNLENEKYYAEPSLRGPSLADGMY